jgi:RNA polymerase sigma factor (sigma-70 family)
VESVSAEASRSRLGPVDAAARKRVAAEIYARNEAALRRIARRFSLCADDAEDALQRALEILLRKAPSDNPRELVKWTQTVVRHEAMAIRRERERTLAGPAAFKREPGREDWVALLPTRADGPPDVAERREAVARSREALQALRPQELRALTLLAEGYSYVEIGEITGFSQTKINRCLSEGRERFRQLVARSESGGRCEELAPLLSAFCDGEADPKEVAELREHLRACAHCRATLRAYRAAPAAASALLPVLPRSIWERAGDALAELWGRLGFGGDAVSQASVGGGGVAAAAKVAVVCLGTAGGAAACVAGGLVPAPVDLHREHESPPVERRLSEIPAPRNPAPQVESASAPEPKRQPAPDPSPQPEEPAESEPAASEPVPSSTAATEYAPPPAPEPAPQPTPSASAGSPAGEFGP